MVMGRFAAGHIAHVLLASRPYVRLGTVDSSQIMQVTRVAPDGHVRQAGGDSRLKLRRLGCGGRGWKVLCGGWHSKGPRSTAWRIVLRPQRRYQALRLRRTAARLRGLTTALRPSVGHPCRSTAQWIA